jgi:peptide/nickel transport system substrate-binding protein
VEKSLQKCFSPLVDFCVLGPLAVRVDGAAAALGGPKQRALLAMLLLHPNEVVSRDRLIDGVWGERPPVTAQRSLESYVSRLRTILGADRIQRRPPGYALRLEPGELDLERFETLLEQGRAAAAGGEAKAASEALGQALALWHGPALADLLYEPFAGVEAERLEERRLLALEERIDADLALGRGAELVSELERLVAEEPLRQRPLGQLMLSLYRAGRQADALGAYQRGRQQLAEELGLEPGPQLRLLERQILEHDPALGVDGPPSTLEKRSKAGRRVWLLAAAAAVAATSVGIGLGLESGRGGRIAEAQTSRLLDLSAGGRPIGSGATLDSAPTSAATGGRSLWLTEPDAGEVVRIDTTSGNVERISVGGQPGALAVGGGAVWVGDGAGGGRLIRIDPKVDKVTRRIPLGGALAAALAFGQRRLWVADPNDESILVVDPVSGTVERTIPLSLHPTELAFGAGALWVADYEANVVAEVDPHSGLTLASVNVGGGPTAVAVDARNRAVWVANFLDSTVSRIDTDTGRLAATLPVGSSPSALALSGSSLWVADEYSQTIARIDPASNIVRQTLAVGGAPTALAASERLFVATRPLGQHRGGTLILLHQNPITIDPALQVDLGPTVSDGLTRDDLVTTSHAGGPEGQRIVPDLALGLPIPTDGGLAYTFRLRPGILYSNGRPVRASDFRRELERVFRLDSPGSSYFADIVGAAACTPAHCSLARGIVTNDEMRTVTFRLRAPNVDFLSNLGQGGLASPVPPGTPFHNVGHRPIPGTGPYRIATASAHEIRYVRNPYFHEWSHAAQPAANPDQIVMHFGLTPTQEARAVEQGRADYSTDGVPGPLLPQVEGRFAAQVHSLPSSETDTLQLNTTLPPFTDVRVRRALNLAIDRTAVARLYGGAHLASPTCQVLPPGITGYVRYCPWTRDPRPDGRWRGPDLNRARALISASGTRGDTVTVWGPSDDPLQGHAVVPYVVRLLHRLGFRARAHLIPQDAFGSVPQRVFERRIQMTPPSWGDSTPYGFFGTWFLCSAPFNHHWFCNTRLDQAIVNAQTLETTDPAAASRAWTRIDHEIADQAAWVPLVNPRGFDFVSARVRNYEYAGGILADQLWVR